MATIYKCDECKKSIDADDPAPLKVSVAQGEPASPDLFVYGDFCSWPCAVIWLTNQSHR